LIRSDSAWLRVEAVGKTSPVFFTVEENSKMSSFSLVAVLQVIIAIGLLNVWLLRVRSATAFRGGTARSLKEEFATYGLGGWVFYLVGFLKVGSALLLLAGLWIDLLVVPAAAIVLVLMLGALAMHVKIKDPPLKFLPAFLMLLMSATVLALSLS
jgi:hypothetical protein